MQVNTVWFELRPAVGPDVLIQLLAAPEIAHVTEPAGAVAPTIPLTVLINVMVPPNIGESGEYVTTSVGVARPTTTDCGVVAGSAA